MEILRIIRVSTIAMLIIVVVQGGASIDLQKQKPINSKAMPEVGGEIIEGLQLSARLDKATFRRDEPVLLKLSIKNTTTKPLFLRASYSQKDYQVFVKNENGKSPALTELGEHLKRNSIIASPESKVNLDPGQESEDQTNVSELYDLTAPSTYYITAKRVVPKMSGSGAVEIASNTVKVTIM